MHQKYRLIRYFVELLLYSLQLFTSQIPLWVRLHTLVLMMRKSRGKVGFERTFIGERVGTLLILRRGL